MRKKGKPEGIVLVFVGLAILFGLTDSLDKLYVAERARRAESHYRRGEELARAGKPAEAVEEYHAALTFAHNNGRYEQALAVSLVSLGRLQEAESHLLELHQQDPNNAEIDLLLARIAAKQGRIDDAIDSYHQAIYGLWPDDPKINRLNARFEVVDALLRAGQSRQALSDLLALADDAPDDPAVLDRIGNMLLQHGSADHAEAVFTRALDADPRDAAAALGIARAEFQQGNYTAAARRVRRAIHLAPENADARGLEDETEEILSLDPTLVNLSATQRYARSRALIEKTSGAFEACLAGRAPTPDQQALLEAAQKFLAARRRREGDTPAGIALADHIWQARQQACRAAPTDEALSLMMTKIAKSNAQ